MLKKWLCMLLALLLCPLFAQAEESAAGMLTHRELTAWADGCVQRARSAETLNDPAEHLTADGYEFIYDFATLYADAPILRADTAISAIVLASDAAADPRGLRVGDSLLDVLDAYYTENPALQGTREAAVLYAVDNLPESAAWGQVLRDGQRVQTVQYAVHAQPSSGEGYTDAGIIYTLAENRVAAIRVYGLNSRITGAEVSSVLYAMMLTELQQEYAMVPFSYDGADLRMLEEADLAFSGLDFLSLTPESAIAALGEPMSDRWVENGDHGYLRVQQFGGCEMTYLFDKTRTEGSLYMLLISADGLEGPRAVRVGDTFSSVYNRFRSGEGAYGENGVEVLYGVAGEGSFGQAAYGSDASAILRYGLTASDGRKVVLQMNFTLMTLTEILLYAE